MKPELRPHQQDAVKKIRNGTVLTGGVGTGKTITSLFYYYEHVMGGTVGDYGSIKNPMDLYVFTTARKRDDMDWQRTAASMGLSRDPEASAGGVKVTVDSYNNIARYRNVKDAFIILDEQRMVGKGAWTKTFIHLAKSNPWIMLSATPGDKWEDYIPLFIANGFYRNRTQFTREHIIMNMYGPYPKVDRYVGVNKLVKLRNSILVEMPYERHTTRHIHEIPVSYDTELFERVVKKRWHVYENRPLRDISEMFSVMRKVVNSDVSRLETVGTLLETHPRLIVFYNFDYELEMLRTLVQTTFDENKVFQNTKDHPSSDSKSVCSTPSTSTMDIWTTSPPLKKQLETKELHPQSSRSQQVAISPSVPGKKSSGTSIGTASYGSTRTSTTSTSISPASTKSATDISGETRKISTNSGSDSTNGMSESRTKKSSNSTANWSESSLQIAEWNGHKHEPVPTGDRWLYLVQYVAGAEAWNCTSTDTVIFYSLTYSYKNFVQAQGRIDRLDTPYSDLHYYLLVSNSAIDKGVRRSLREKRDFNESDFLGKS